MTPSRLHAPPPPPDASHNVVGGPPDTSIFLSFPSAKNPRKRLSGDQNGRKAPSVPASTCAVSVSSERIQRADFPSALVAAKAIRRPSGETARGAAGAPVAAYCRAKLHVSGGETRNRTDCASSGERWKY